uniref:Capsid protein n=2 Tax=viral metagenome TaxID=1070528 RepID=A0A6M3IS61_9ZZZZ
MLAKTDDEEKARRAAWAAIKAKYEQSESGEWKARESFQGADRSHPIRFRAAQQADDSGLLWEAVLIAPGMSQGYPTFYWTDEVLEAAVAVFQGVDVNAYELTADFFTHLPIPVIEVMEDVKRYLVAMKVGWIETTWYEAGVGIKANIRLLEAGRWLSDVLKQGIGQGNGDVLGLSIDSRIQGMEVNVEGSSIIWVTKIISASSVDVVTYPAAGGKFLRAVAAINNHKEGTMDREKLLALIEKAKPDLLKGKDRAALKEDEILEMARMAMDHEAAVADAVAKADADAKAKAAQRAAQSTAAAGTPPTLDQITEEIRKATEAVEQRAACARLLDTALGDELNLPRPAKRRIQKQFKDKIFEQTALDAAIKEEKDYLAAMSIPGTGLDLGDQTRFSGGIGTLDKIQMAIDRTFGLKKEDAQGIARMDDSLNAAFFRTDRYAGNMQVMRAAQDYDGFDQIPRFRGLLEMYVALTGDPEVTGFFNRKALSADLRAMQDITSSTFTYALGNTLARRLILAYRRPDYGQDILISTRKPVKDFRQQEAVKIGGFNKLETVNTDTGDYNEIAAITDEESTYTVTERGNILTFSRRFILNDDINLMMRMVDQLGIAAIWTLADFVWSFFVDNATCADGTAWFTSGHGNLGSTALSISTANTAYIALAKMTEKDSARRLGLLDDLNVKPYLVHPPDLRSAAAAIANDEIYYTSNDLTTRTANPLYNKVVPQQCSLMVDTTDWGLILPGNLVDHLEIGFLQGREEPEMVVADSPQSEQTFIGRRIRYRISHDYSGAVVDYAGAYKAIV